MRLLLCLLCLFMVWSDPAPAQSSSSRPLDLGPAQIGMRLNQLRFAPLPANAKLVCGRDQDKPPGAERAPLTLPGAMVSASVDRCAIFQDDGKNNWVLRPAQLAGVTTDFWFMSIEDEGGVQRIFQIVGRQPRESFAKTTQFLSERWGKPVQQVPNFVRWLNGTHEGQMTEDGEGLMIFLFDTKLFQLMESRMPKGKPKKGG